MAVTYAWRLDANKYAYILNPEYPEEPLLVEEALTTDNLNLVARTANSKYVEAENGLEAYRTDFAKMVSAINDKEEWSNAGSYDLLSADIYYSVDAYDCADLRGVGIKGIRFLGTADPKTFDINEPAWTPIDFPKNEGGVLNNLSGKYSVYGIYMEDQDADNSSPESVFVVYNGRNGEDYEGGQSTATLTSRLDDLEAYCKGEDSYKDDGGIPQLQARCSALELNVDSLMDYTGANELEDLQETVAQHTTTIANLDENCVKRSEYDESIKNLQSLIEKLEASLPSSADVEIQSVSAYSGNRTVYLLFVNPKYPNKLYYSTECFMYNSELYCKKLSNVKSYSGEENDSTDSSITVSLYDATKEEELCLVLYNPDPSESDKLFYSKDITLNANTLSVEAEQLTISAEEYKNTSDVRSSGTDFTKISAAKDETTYRIACYTPLNQYNICYDTLTHVKNGIMGMGAFYEMDK